MSISATRLWLTLFAVAASTMSVFFLGRRRQLSQAAGRHGRENWEREMSSLEERNSKEYPLDNIFVRMKHSGNHLRKSEPATTNNGILGWGAESSIVEKGSSTEPTSVSSTGSSAPSLVPSNALSTSNPSRSDTESLGWASVLETSESPRSNAPSSSAPSFRMPESESITETLGWASVPTISSAESPSYGAPSLLPSGALLISPSVGPSWQPSYNPTSSTEPSTLQMPSLKKDGSKKDLAALNLNSQESRGYADIFDEGGVEGQSQTSEGPMTLEWASILGEPEKTSDKEERRTPEPKPVKATTDRTRKRPEDSADDADDAADTADTADTSLPRWGGSKRGSNGMPYRKRGKGGKGGKNKSSNMKSSKISQSKTSKASKSKTSKSKGSAEKTQPPDLCEDYDYRSPFDVSLDRLDGSDKKICVPSVIETGDDLENISIFLELIEILGLTEILATCIGPFTLAAPRDEAWEMLGSAVLDSLKRPENFDILDELIRYHIIPGFIPTPAGKVVSLSGQPLVVSRDKSMFNDATVVDEADACNGELFVLDLVLVPLEATPSPAPASGSPSPSNVPSFYVMTRAPTLQPTTLVPTMSPTKLPTMIPTTLAPTLQPTTVAPTISPTKLPTMMPTTLAPTNAPTLAPTTTFPTMAPTTDAPSMALSSDAPSSFPTNAPVTEAPTASRFDTPVCLISEIPTVGTPEPMPDNRVLLRDYYMSYTASGATREPSDIEYKEIRTAKRQYFEVFLSDHFSTIPGVTLQAVRTVLYYATDKVSVPEPEYNIYMEYSGTELVFTPDSDPALIPTEKEVFELLQLGITPNYILDGVRIFDTSPFASTTQVILRPVDCEALQ